MLPPSLISREALASLLYYATRAPEGAIVEVGVYRGGSAAVLACLGRELYLYDTFAGMPVSGEFDTHPLGHFDDCSAAAVQAAIPSAHVIVGTFPDSLVAMPPVGFCHADGDQYETTRDILVHLPPLMVRGGYLLFDDYGVRDCRGCTKAVDESPYRRLVIAETGKALIIL